MQGSSRACMRTSRRASVGGGAVGGTMAAVTTDHDHGNCGW